MDPATSHHIACLQRISKGDHEAFAELYRSTSPKLFGIICRIIRQSSVAEDVLQEVYAKVWQQASKYDSSRASPLSWMIVIARNQAIDEIRRRPIRKQAEDFDEEKLIDTTPGPSQQTEVNLQLEKLTKCLGKLDDDRKEAIKMAYLKGYTRQELANHFRQPIGSIKSWLHRGLGQLRECLNR